MMSHRRRATLGFLCALFAFSPGPSPHVVRAADGDAPSSAASPAREAAYRENNLGVALLEQFRFADAADAFTRALQKDPTLFLAKVNHAIARLYVPDHDAARKVAEEALKEQPDSPQLNYVLGLIARGEGRAEDAVPYLEKILARDPTDVGANLTLGQVYLQLREFERAVALFETAAAAEPYNVSAIYNLGVAQNRAGRREEAQATLEKFQKLRDSAYKTSLGQNYLEQGRYAEALPSTGAEEDLVDAGTPAVSFVEQDGSDVPSPSTGPAAPRGASLGEPPSPEKAARVLVRAALTLTDVDGDSRLDVVEAGVSGLRVLRNEGGGLRDVTTSVGLGGVSAAAAVAGDYDNDGHGDLLVLRPGGLSLFRHDGKGRFEDATSAAHLPAWPHVALSAAFVDIDHDGDLDVFVAGLADVEGTPQGGSGRFPEAFAPAPSLLLQNDGDGTFSDITSRTGLGAPAHALAVIPTDFDNRRDVDLFVLRRDAPPALFKNLRDGTFRDVALELGLVAAGPFRSAAAADVNKDGYVDFFLGGDTTSWLALSDGRGAFVVTQAPAGAAGAEAAQLVDYDNDGLIDLVVATERGMRLLRNVGASWSDVTATAFAGVGTTTLDGSALGVADLDADGDQDLLLATPRKLRALVNEGGNRNHSFAVDLSGRVTNRGGVGVKIEIRAGSLRQKLETVAAVPMPAPADLVFGLGSRTAPDAVRVIWVSGIVQTETEFKAPVTGTREAFALTELDRKPSSCPFLYAWNGERFEFVTDFLGGGEMGYKVAPGVWNEPDPDELVRIAPEQLRPRDGRYELRVTNELEEVLYLDQIRLLAIDHPADVSVFPNEGMTVPPKPARLFAARDPRVPRATDHKGRDVTLRLARRDRVFVDELPLLRIRGYAEEHALTLDLGGLPPTHTLLLLTGWTDYAFSSDNVAAHQAGLALVPPRLEAEAADGRWTTVVGQVGVPVGRPQTVVVDLSGLPLGPSRRVRVVTSMRVYWDEAKAAAPADDVVLRPAPLAPQRALLRERGFSAETSPDGREPWSYDYASVSWLSPWKTMPGRYTRLGDVRPLLDGTDDRFVISKPGDEVSLSFDARGLPPTSAGFVRTFLLAGDGFSKEMDINSASPDVVRPLPHHGMKGYPYAAGDVPAAVRERWAELEEWTTRQVARPIVPIELAAAGESAAPSRVEDR